MLLAGWLLAGQAALGTEQLMSERVLQSLRQHLNTRTLIAPESMPTNFILAALTLESRRVAAGSGSHQLPSYSLRYASKERSPYQEFIELKVIPPWKRSLPRQARPECEPGETRISVPQPRFKRYTLAICASANHQQGAPPYRARLLGAGNWFDAHAYVRDVRTFLQFVASLKEID